MTPDRIADLRNRHANSIRNTATGRALEECLREIERLHTAIDTLRQNVTTNAGNVYCPFAYVWQSVWDEFERQVDAKPNTKQ